MRMAIIFTHEDWQRVSFKKFIDYHLLQNGQALSPDIGDSKGKLSAEINQGKWIAKCPVEGCNGAVVVSSSTPYFMCPYCRNFDNKGKWYEVKFPKDKEKIEKILLKRPARDGFSAQHRNWLPGETVKDLEKENKERGIE